MLSLDGGVLHCSPVVAFAITLLGRDGASRLVMLVGDDGLDTLQRRRDFFIVHCQLGRLGRLEVGQADDGGGGNDDQADDNDNANDDAEHERVIIVLLVVRLINRQLHHALATGTSYAWRADASIAINNAAILAFDLLLASDAGITDGALARHELLVEEVVDIAHRKGATVETDCPLDTVEGALSVIVAHVATSLGEAWVGGNVAMGANPAAAEALACIGAIVDALTVSTTGTGDAIAAVGPLEATITLTFAWGNAAAMYGARWVTYG